MTLNKTALDRYITGNYGEYQFTNEPFCNHRERVYLGDEPDEYDPNKSYPTYQCVGCGDLFDEPGRTCARAMRDGRCQMDPGHRGRCSTVTFTCDNCDKTRRGQPVAYARNPWDGVAEAQFCFMCVKVYRR